MTALKCLEKIERSKLTEDKTPRPFSEDALFYTDRLAVILDGATGIQKERLLKTKDSDPSWLSRTMGEMILEADESSPSLPTEKILLAALTRTIAIFEAEATVGAETPKYEFPTSTLLLARVPEDGRMELFHLADGVILYEENGRLTVLSAGRNMKELTAWVARQNARFAGEPPERKERLYLEGARQVRERRNRPGHYGVLDLTTDWLAHEDLQKATLSPSPGDRILMTSDGLERLVELYGVYPSYGAFFKAASTEGLAFLYDRLRQIEMDDWEKKKHPRRVRTDDVSAILLEVI